MIDGANFRLQSILDEILQSHFFIKRGRENRLNFSFGNKRKKVACYGEPRGMSVVKTHKIGDSTMKVKKEDDFYYRLL